MRTKELKLYDYDEKISIIMETHKINNRNSISKKYGVGESTIRAWERDLKNGTLKKEENIVIEDLFSCNLKTDLIKLCEIIKDDISDKIKITGIIPFMISVGYKESELLGFFDITKKRYKQYQN